MISSQHLTRKNIVSWFFNQSACYFVVLERPSGAWHQDIQPIQTRSRPDSV
ncbi:hypothetical protein [Limnobaculum parvum]|uniref:hypothetical protein n=1 Tax=Limnobaculum parvum TaxID=2172103 RepID=UPI0013005270|nr:hypothetical protein [Limnobaculum parvum]